MIITSDCKAMTKLITGSRNVYKNEDVTRTFHYMLRAARYKSSFRQTGFKELQTRLGAGDEILPRKTVQRSGGASRKLYFSSSVVTLLQTIVKNTSGALSGLIPFHLTWALGKLQQRVERSDIWMREEERKKKKKKSTRKVQI